MSRGMVGNAKDFGLASNVLHEDNLSDAYAALLSGSATFLTFS